MKDNSHAKKQARAQLNSILEMVEEWHDTNDDDAFEEAERAILESALSVEVRSDWHAPGTDPDIDTEYQILLCTGAPAVMIRGELNGYQRPETARLYYQDWFTPWTEYTDISESEREAMLTYCQCFYFDA